MPFGKMGSRATVARKQPSAVVSANTSQGSKSAKDTATPTPAQFIQQHQAAAKAQQQQQGFVTDQSKDSETTPPRERQQVDVLTHKTSSKKSKGFSSPKTFQPHLAPVPASSSPTSSINTGHTPLITSPGGTSNPIKLAMKNLEKAAETGRSVLLVQREAEINAVKGTKSTKSAQDSPE